MKHTKESIAQYCVDSKGDKDLAEQIARQFERAGFGRREGLYSLLGRYPFVGIDRQGFIDNGDTPSDSVLLKVDATETTLSELTKMVDEMLGDEYAIVREFLLFEYPDGSRRHWDKRIEEFKEHRTKHTVTIRELRNFYANIKGIDIDKIEVKEEWK